MNKIYPPNKTGSKEYLPLLLLSAKIGTRSQRIKSRHCCGLLPAWTRSFQGEVVSDQTFRVGLLEQEPDLDKTKTGKEIVEEGVKATVDLLEGI